jgi:predicted transcriptional regulator
MNLSPDELRRLATDIVSAYVSYNTIPNTELPTLIRTVHAAVANVGNNSAEDAAETARKPAVPIRRSI